MKPMIKRYTQVTVLPEGEPIFSTMATQVSIEDEAGGEFVRITQHRDNGDVGEIDINPEEWPAIRDAIDEMVRECRKEDT